FSKALLTVAQHEAEQHAKRFCPLGSQVRKIGGDKLPSDIRPVGTGQKVHVFHQHVVRQDDRFAPDFEHGGIVGETARGRMMGEGPQAVDESGLAAQRTALATASSTPLTNFASRSSKNACATSTYSLIAVAVGTSARASSS